MSVVDTIQTKVEASHLDPVARQMSNNSCTTTDVYPSLRCANTIAVSGSLTPVTLQRLLTPSNAISAV